jgi:hypothetical protein
MDQDQKRLRSSILLGAWIYLLILWAYIVADSFIFPPYQYLPISNYIPIRENIIADLAFPLSFICFVLWKYLKE